MRFGIATFVSDEGVRPGVLGRAVEERGFGSLFVAEQSHIPVNRESRWPGGDELPRFYYRTLDPFVALTAAAATTSRLTLGTGVALLPQRDVIHTAKLTASLDLVCDGRLVLGVGVGWNREEVSNHGVDPTTRGKLLNEQLAALTEIWTRDEAQFHGDHVNFDPIFCWPKPVRKPHPPIYIGGDSPAALRRLAAHGDGWLPTFATPPEKIRRALDRLSEQGRPDVPVTVANAPADPAAFNRYAEAGVSEVALNLPTLPEAQTLRALDELAAVVAAHR